MAQGEPLECTLMARGVDMNYFEATVEAPFNGHAPTPQIKQQLIDEFITMALNANPNGTQGEPEIVSSCLVTGQSFAITLRIGLVDNGEESRAARNGEDQSGRIEETHSGQRSPTETRKSR